MKLFGQYLIEKGAITEENLVRALVAQLENTPPVPEIVLKENLLSIPQMSKVFQTQAKQRLGFIEAAKELGYWSEKIQNDVERALILNRRPLGEILTQQGIDITLISKLLDDFLGESENETEIETDQFTEDHALAMSLVEEISSENFSEEKPKTTEIEIPLYCEKLNINVFCDLMLMVSFGQSGMFTAAHLKEGIDVIHSLKGTARYSNLPRSEAILTGIENTLHRVLKAGIEKVGPNFIDKIEVYIKKCLDLVWLIREDLVTGLGEDESIERHGLRSLFQQIASQESTK